jgi:hypothetical protein
MANKRAPPEPDLPNIRRQLRTPRPLWRLFGWGSAATIALAAAAVTSQTDAGSQRLQLALTHIGEPARAVAQIPPHAAEAEAETRRLAAQVRELAADRERLSARIASLERNIDDVTGSIKQQAAQAAMTPAADSPPPAPSAPATAAALTAAEPPPAAALPVLPPLAVPATSQAVASWPATSPPQAEEPTIEPVPLPPVRVASAPPRDTDAAATPPLRPEFGIDLGGGSSVEALRIHWVALKASYGPLLAGLRPVVAQHPRHPAGIDFRLVAGPLPNIGVAAQLCARFPISRTGCRPAKFYGTYLAEH